MNVATQILEARPDQRGVDHATLSLAVDALADVVIVATTCADACLVMPDADDRVECIQACNDAADVAGTTSRVLMRTGPTVEGTRALVDATTKILSETSAVCAEHGVDHKHARICADVTARAEQAMAALQVAVASAMSDS